MSGYLSYVRIPIITMSGFLSLAVGAIYFKQNELIYPRYLPAGARSEAGVPRPNMFGLSDFDDLRIPTPDGETLSAFLIRPSNKTAARPVTVLMFHGNAGNIGHRVPIAKVIEENAGCNIFMLEYRGYGLSTGTPDEAGLLIDAQTALDYVRTAESTKGNDIIVYGQSLGGAVSVQLVARNHDTGDIKGLVLENTFTTMRKLIPSAFPPARYLAWCCHQKWTTEDYLPQIKDIPVLFLSGLKDEIIPPSHMKHLRNICRSSDVTWREFPNGTHNESVSEPMYFDYIIDFISKKARRT